MCEALNQVKCHPLLDWLFITVVDVFANNKKVYIDRQKGSNRLIMKLAESKVNGIKYLGQEGMMMGRQMERD